MKFHSEFFFVIIYLSVFLDLLYSQDNDSKLINALSDLKSEDKNIRLKAIETIGNLGTEAKEVAPSLIKILRNKDWLLRNEALDALLKIGESKKAISNIIELLKDDNEHIRAKSVKILGSMGIDSHRAINSLLELLKEKNIYLDEELILSLNKIVYGISELKASFDEIDPEIKKTIGIIIKALESDNEKVRYWAILAVGTIGLKAKDAIPKLLKLLSDKKILIKKDICLDLIKTLRQMSLDAHIATPNLMAFLKDTDLAEESTLILNRIVQEISELKGNLGEIDPEIKKTIDIIIKALESNNEKIRYWAILAVGKLGPKAKDAVPILRNLLNDSISIIRKNVARSLGKIGSEAKDAIVDLRKLLSDENEQVRIYTKIALDKITLKIKDEKESKLFLEAKKLHQEGLTKHEKGDFENAINDFNKALSIDSEFVEIYNDRGASLADLGNIEDAIKDYKTAISLKPDIPEPFFNLGIIKQDRGELKEAIEYYTEALNLYLKKPIKNYRYVDIYFYRATARYARNEIEISKKDIEIYLSITKNIKNIDVENNKEWIFKKFPDLLNKYVILAQEETPDDFLKMSQENLKKYSLAELTGLDPLKDQKWLEGFSENIKKNPNNYLFLNHLSQLSLTQAKTLAQFKGYVLSLNGLTQIDEITTEILAQFQCKVLWLNGIQQLDEATAKALAQFQGGLYLNGIKQIDEATAKALAQFQCKVLWLNGVQQLDEATVKILAQFKGQGLLLNGVQQIDEGTAKALVDRKGVVLWLNGVQQLDESTVKILAQFQGKCLYLNGLQQIDESTAKALAQFKGTIYATEKIEAQIKKYK